MFPILSGNSASTGYNLTRSLRFRSSASAYLNRTPASATNRQKWTWSSWVKLAPVSVQAMIFNAGLDGNNRTQITYEPGGTLGIAQVASGSVTLNLATTAVYRDYAAWYHIVVACDSTQATSSDRVKLYVNGTQVTAFTTATYFAQNALTYVNSNISHVIGGYIAASTNYYDGYMADVNLIDGQALTPSSFGETDTITGVWKPKRYAGTYGTNGFYLPFTDNSALTTSSNVGLGKDFSGNGNYWVTNNISITSGVTYDSMTDVPTLTSATASNFCVWNPVYGALPSITDGNLNANTNQTTAYGSISVKTGKWYWEILVSTSDYLGVIDNTYIKTDNAWDSQVLAYQKNGNKYNGTSTAYGASFTNNDLISIALDMDGGTISFYKNGTSQGVAFSSNVSGRELRPFVYSNAAGAHYGNFGQRPFTYTPPTGFVALNTYNLPTSTIVKGNTVMDATLWTGNGTSQTITNAAAFKPDFVWIKMRSAAYYNILTDSVRGYNKQWFSNDAIAEESRTDRLTSFNSNGFSVGSYTDVNNNGSTFVGWQWQAGQGSSSSNTNGTITSTVSVNASAGFSVIGYTGNGTSGATIGHGLGVAPSLIIIKRRLTPPSVPNSIVYHSSVGNTGALVLDTTLATQTSSAFWNNTTPGSSVFTVGNDANTNNSGNTFIAYAWTPIAGYSAFGSYTGNGSSDGPFVYTGFRPRWIMTKQSSAAGQSWNIFDTARNTYNLANTTLYANQSSAEDSVSNAYDILSNGFKLRTSASQGNTNGATYVYMAFAENPFKNALAR